MSDIDTAVVDSLKVLDPGRPIREATKMVRRGECSDVPLATVPHFYLRLPTCLEQHGRHNFGPF